MAIDYKTITSDNDKLQAVYSLIGQAISEVNLNAAVAKADWDNNKGKWESYRQRYTAYLWPLLREKKRLRLEIRRSIISDDDFRKLNWDDKKALVEGFEGDKNKWKDQPTVAASTELDDLKGINFSSLKGNVFDPTEDWTTYSETDPNSDITKNANVITITTARNDSGAHVEKSFGASHFGYVYHNVNVRATAQDQYAIMCFWGLTDSPYFTLDDKESNATGCQAWLERWDGSYAIFIADNPTADYDYGTYVINTYYYPTMMRLLGDALIEWVYSDAARTTIHDILVCDTDGTLYEYVQGAHFGDHYGGPAADSTGTIEYLDVFSLPSSADYANVITRAHSYTTAGNSLVVTMPSGIQAGDLLLVFVSHDTSANITQSGAADWTRIDTNANGTAVQQAIFAKIAAGGDSLTLTDNADNQDMIAIAVRINNHGVADVSTDIPLGTAATGNSNAPNPPNCNPAVSKKWLWIEMLAADDFMEETGYFWTSGYTPILSGHSSVGTACTIGVACRENEDSSEDPAAMALSGAEEWVAQTLGIPPLGATGGSEGKSANMGAKMIAQKMI